MPTSHLLRRSLVVLSAALFLAACSHTKAPQPSPLPAEDSTEIEATNRNDSQPAGQPSPAASPMSASDNSKVKAEIDASLKTVDESINKTSDDDFNPSKLQDL